MWNTHKKNGGKFNELTIEFKKHKSFDVAIQSIKNKIGLNRTSLFDTVNELELIEKESLKVIDMLEKEGIGVITYDQFHEFEALKEVKGSYFFFYKGEISILKETKKDFVAVVGSRKTPKTYEKYFDKIPKDKIIVSGLANGADLMAHEWAIDNKKQIVVFPGVDIYNKPKTGMKRTIFEYAENNGILLSEVFPGSKTFDKSMFLKRNKWMAQMTDSTYALYFKGMSGTLGELTEAIKTNSNVYIPKDVLEMNKTFFEEHKNLLPIYKGSKCL